MDKALRSRIHRLVRDSKDVLKQANDNVADSSKAAKNVPDPKRLAIEWKGLVGDKKHDFLIEIRTNIKKTDEEPTETETDQEPKKTSEGQAWKVAWDLTKACIYVQHGGLARETQIALSDFTNELMNKTVAFFEQAKNVKCKKAMNEEEKNDEEGKNAKWVDTAFYCAVYAEAFYRAETPSTNLENFAKELAQRAADILECFPFSTAEPDSTKIFWHENYSEVITNYDHDKELALNTVRAAGIWKHLHRLNISPPEWNLKLPSVDEDQLNETLLSLLERAVAPDTPKAPPLLLTLAARALAGRFPNGSRTPSPRWRKALSLTVEHVIDRQGAQAEADWGLPSAFKKDRNPTATRYLPLLHVLDLPEVVLIDSSERVIAACEGAIAEVTAGLENVERMLRNDNWGGTAGRVRKFYRNVVEGMAVGAAVYERTRDILSEAVLDDLGATIPHVKDDESIKTRAPYCLGFRESLLKGVIEPWTTWREDRPGAILVFGPPGTGKTSNARLIAAELNRVTPNNTRWWRFLSITPADFVREGRDKIVGSAEKLFKDLKDVRGCVVLMDEMEEFLRARGRSDVDPDARLITTAFLPLLQDISDRRELVLIVATNFVGAIDPAVLRPGRFDMILPLGPMGGSGRVKAIRQILKKKYETVKSIKAHFKILKENKTPDDALVEAIRKISERKWTKISKTLKDTDRAVLDLLKSSTAEQKLETVRKILRKIREAILQIMDTDKDIKKVLEENYETDVGLKALSAVLGEKGASDAALVEAILEILRAKHKTTLEATDKKVKEILKEKYKTDGDKLEAFLRILTTIDDAVLQILKVNYGIKEDRDLDDAVLQTLKPRYATEILPPAKLKILIVLTQLVRYTQGCTFTELEKMIDEVEEEVKNFLQAKKKEEGSALSQLVRKLWMTRVKKQPTALLGDAGASWESFREEESRFARRAPGVENPSGESYWQRPHFPDYAARHGDST